MTEIMVHFFQQIGFTENIAQGLGYGVISTVILLSTIIATWLIRKILSTTVVHFIQHNNYTWDDALIHNDFFGRVSWFAPVAILYLSKDLLLPAELATAVFIHRLLLCAFVIVSVRCVISLLKSIDEIYREVRRAGGTPIRGYIDAAKIITYILGVIFILAILTNQSPWGLLSVLGGLTAVTMLVFKDTILGFVASIQLSGSDMVRIGDWIEMPAYGADGDVIDVSIHTVKVQNFDKTISTIPTYDLVSGSFKNWRGMFESSGRRIKRPITIDMNSIRFISDEELERLGEISLIKDYISAKHQEIEKYNQEHNVDTSTIINGRRQTNVGIFRAYIIAYLRNHSMINKDMTFLVRHLKPTEHGLPIELYVFSSDKNWINYEAIQADIFDHLLAALPIFDLRVFQAPSGYDFRHLSNAGTH